MVSGERTASPAGDRSGVRDRFAGWVLLEGDRPLVADAIVAASVVGSRALRKRVERSDADRAPGPVAGPTDVAENGRSSDARTPAIDVLGDVGGPA